MTTKKRRRDRTPNPFSTVKPWAHRPEDRRGGARPLPVYMSVRRRRQLLAALGANVRRARHEMGITQAQLAQGCFLSPGDLSRIERGMREARILSVLLLARGLGVSIDDLFIDAPAELVPDEDAVVSTKHVNNGDS